MLHMYKGLTLDIDKVVIDERSNLVKTGRIIDGAEFVLPLPQFEAGYKCVDFKKTVDTMDWLRKKGLLPVESAESPAA